VQRIYAKLAQIREAYRARIISVVVKTKPQFITLEKLNIKGMKKNRHLAKAISGQGFYFFKVRLLEACKRFGIELREVGMFYPSSKLCSCCGHKKVQLSLSERTFHCESCGHKMDRDLNAAINLRDAREYVVLT